MPSNFNPNIPQANDRLSTSQQDLLKNNAQLDTSFGIDHYKFSDISSNNGFHNQVTTPIIVGSAHPTTTTNPIFYAMQDSGNVGTIQYSRGPNNAHPTPITELHSPTAPIALAPNATTNVIDFAGLFQVTGTLYITNWSPSGSGDTLTVCDFSWSGNGGGTFKIINTSTAVAPLVGVGSGASILQIKNTNSAPANNVFWTLCFHRINE